jgi:hypothetical protein
VLCGAVTCGDGCWRPHAVGAWTFTAAPGGATLLLAHPSGTRLWVAKERASVRWRSAVLWGGGVVEATPAGHVSRCATPVARDQSRIDAAMRLDRGEVRGHHCHWHASRMPSSWAAGCCCFLLWTDMTARASIRWCGMASSPA